MKKIFILSCIVIGMLACTQSAKEQKILITTKSEKARQLLADAMSSFEDYNRAKFQELAIKSLNEDPDFFMANYMLAFNSLISSNEKSFTEYADKAVKCKANLSIGEVMLREAMRKYLVNRKADNSEIGKKLIKAFPDDVSAYDNYAWFLYVIRDNQGIIKLLERAVTIFKTHASFYNMLGYSYMATGENEKAQKVFDKYLELSPGIPNSHDSKGDYFMNMKDYSNAYKSYMKAHEIDTLWSYKKAMRAKAIADSISAIKK